MGMIIRSIVAPLSASGMVRIRGFGVRDTGIFASVRLDTYYCDFYEDVPLFNCKEVAVVFRRLDQTAKNWVNPGPSGLAPTAAANNQLLPGFGAVMIAVDGGPASLASLDVEYFSNWEIIIDDSDATAQLATRPPPYSPHADAVVAEVSSAMQTVYLEGKKAVEKEIKNLGVSLLGRLRGSVRLPMIMP